MGCNGDSCDIQLKNMAQGLTPEARAKLMNWLGVMEPIDYDAPGSTVRETGV